MIPRALAMLWLGWACVGLAQAQPSPERQPFSAFLAAVWKEAQAIGITRATFDLAFAGVAPDPRVIAATKRQPEYGKPAGAYINSAVSTQRAASGRAKEAQLRPTLDAIEKAYGVERWIVLSTWGLETSYGALKATWDVPRSLATLDYVEYRNPFFHNELLVALRILQEGHIGRDGFRGSWAGAMGQPQFMPSSFMKYAVDFTGDGKRDIWTSVPDTLASIANYFQKQGWVPKQPWGFEVMVPKGFDYRRSRATFSEWAALGVMRADSGKYPASGDGILFFPAGAPGPAFVVTANFDVIKQYNDSDVYALALAHLADRMRGGPPIRTAWPSNDVQLPRNDRIALQRKLADLGYDQTRFTSHIDFKMRDFIRAEQVKHGLLPDGHPTATLLDRMGVKR